uniref:Uncharacterized protein n=1 Tax=Siphoviridae sp. ctMgg26 TaxID=2825462 RepID=A0A8S5PZ23_9CAUD|nr:MAG TPA: hypothetical protein [Siphoviridae sp. ctMgg26]
MLGRGNPSEYPKIQKEIIYENTLTSYRNCDILIIVR